MGPRWVDGVAFPSTQRDRANLQLVSGFPLQRMTEDGEVADVAMFFASDHAKAVTGQHLMVNSGEIMR